MILIITGIVDVSTLRVIDWLLFYKKNFVIINEYSNVQLIDYSYNNNRHDFTLCIDGKELKYSNITGFWHRRARINHETFSVRSPEKSTLQFIHLLNKYLKAEEGIILYSLYEKLAKIKHSIGNYINSDVSKLKQLNVAVEIGLNVPDTLITNSKDKVKKYFKMKNVITKAIHFTPDIIHKEFNYKLYTEKVNIDKLPVKFQYTLFQENISKKIELRIFYLKEKLFTMAINSQNAIATSTDYRNYDYELPTRVFPYILPKEICKKIIVLMRRLNLTSGSLDMTLSISNKYYFLEVNPVGQFGIVSASCNYNLEKRIAESLFNHEI